jgi:hypothetical protein
MKTTDFLDLQQSLNLYIVDSGQINWTYKDIYEVVGQEFVEKESDFKDHQLTGNSYELSVGDEVEFFYDSQDSYNQKFLKDFKAGKISEEEFRNQALIFIKKDGKYYSVLKGMRDNATDENMLVIRDKALTLAKEGKTGAIGNTTVSQIVLGSPKFILNVVNKPTELPITERGLEEVVATGYIMDNEFTLSDKTLEATTDQSFVGKMSKSMEGKKIPVVVIKKGAHMVAYPITVIKKANSQADKFDAILANETSTPAQKIKEINDLLIATKISPGAYNLTDLSEQEKLDRIQKDLADHKIYTTSDTFAEGYDKSNLKEDATIKIDLEDLTTSISSPKVRINLEEINIYETRETKYEDLVDIENILHDMSKKMNDLSYRTDIVPGGDVSLEIDAFNRYHSDDAFITEDLKNHSNKLHNIKMFIESYGMLMKGKTKEHKLVREALGPEFLKESDRVISKLNFLKKQVDTKTNPEVKDKRDELEDC